MIGLIKDLRLKKEGKMTFNDDDDRFLHSYYTLIKKSIGEFTRKDMKMDDKMWNHFFKLNGDNLRVSLSYNGGTYHFDLYDNKVVLTSGMFGEDHGLNDFFINHVLIRDRTKVKSE